MTTFYYYKTQSEKLFRESENIIRCEASSNYTKLYYTNNKTLLVAKTLKQCQADMQCDLFLRVHHSHLVNKNFIVSMINNNLQLSNGNILEISRRKVKQIKLALIN